LSSTRSIVVAGEVVASVVSSATKAAAVAGGEREHGGQRESHRATIE